jgi:hypothetical protein
MNAPLLARLSGRPMALALRALDGLLAFDPQTRGPMLQRRDEDRDAAGYALTEDGIAVVPIVGPLLTRGDWLTSLIGATDYGALGRTLETALADPSAGSSISFDRIGRNTGELGQAALGSCRRGGASVEYATASAADRLYVTRTAEIGSVALLADTTPDPSLAGTRSHLGNGLRLRPLPSIGRPSGLHKAKNRSFGSRPAGSAAKSGEMRSRKYIRSDRPCFTCT